MLKFFRGVWNWINCIMTSAISPVSITLYRKHYLVRVPSHLVCLFASCMNRSAILVLLGFTTSYASVICLTPARRRKPYVVPYVRWKKAAFLKPPVQSLIKVLRPSQSRFQQSGEGSMPLPSGCHRRIFACPFCFPSKNMKTSTAIACLSSLFWGLWVS